VHKACVLVSLFYKISVNIMSILFQCTLILPGFISETCLITVPAVSSVRSVTAINLSDNCACCQLSALCCCDKPVSRKCQLSDKINGHLCHCSVTNFCICHKCFNVAEPLLGTCNYEGKSKTILTFAITHL
jgi:hypothetical protein